MQSIFTLLAEKFPVAAQCASALGMTRQAYTQAIARNNLSPLYTIRAADILDIDAAAVIASIAATLPPAERAALTRKNTPAPVRNPSPSPPRQSDVDAPTETTLYYVKKAQQQKSAQSRDEKKSNVHSITSQDQQTAIEIIKWCLVVAKLPADSPRFARYVSRWVVPDKIAYAKEQGTFDATIANCPPIDPAWVRFVPAALAEYKAFLPIYHGKKPDQTDSAQLCIKRLSA